MIAITKRAFQKRIAATLLLAAGLSSATAADSFPTRTVRLVVPAAPGGLADVTARQIALKMSDTLGQPVIVENKPGGDTLLATRLVKEAPADGYTVLYQGAGITVLPSLKREPGYGFEKDFTGLGGIFRVQFLMVVGANQPDKTLADFIARAKANPKTLTYASGGTGSGPHLAAASFLRRAGLDVMHVPYKGNAAAMPDVLTGRVDMIFDVYATSVGYIQGGKARALAIASPKRHPSLPDVPTLGEQGIADAGYNEWHALFVSAATPKETVRRLSDALHAAVISMSDRFRSDGNEPITMPLDEWNKAVRAQAAKTEGLIKDLALPKQD